MRLIALIILLLCSSSCSKHQEELPMLTVITSINGVGDNGYNDEIIAGVMQFHQKYEVGLSLRTPEDMAEAESLLHEWLKNHNPTRKSLLVLASEEYESIIKSTVPKLSSNQNILLFESVGKDLPDGVYSFRFRRYGAAYLAACLARECPEAQIITAMPNASGTADAVSGFLDGYREQGKKEAGVISLAEDFGGYAMPDKAYRLTSDMYERSFVFPLAGGSNNGIYKYSREHPFSRLLVSGMDVDCSAYSSRIPFSMVIDMERIVREYLTAWYEGETLPEHREMKLGEGVRIVLNPDFYDDIEILEDYYLEESYWRDAMDFYYDLAKEKEEAYYGVE